MRTRPLVGLLGIALTISAAALSVPVQAAASASGSAMHARAIPKSDDDLLLKRGGQGSRVVAELGNKLPEAARRNGLTPLQLRFVLVSDDTAHLGRDGRLYYTETAPAQADVRSERGATSWRRDSGIGLPPTSDAYTLHSQPVGKRKHTIYLDFDGYLLPDDSYWATPQDPEHPEIFITPGQYPGVGGSDAQLRAFVVKVWQIVADRYAPFDVDVTTQDPGSGAYTRTSGGDDTWGDHVVFTDATGPRTQYCGTCAGVALVDIFDEVDGSSDLEPVWVFTSATGTSAASAAYTANHEIGHTLGLVHDGVAGGSAYYNGGTGNWVPVMGIGNWHALQQFSKGEYTGAENKWWVNGVFQTIPLQDDLAIIGSNVASSSTVGAGFDLDDWGNNATSPTVLGTAFPFVRDGIIANAADDDTFTVTTDCVGNLTAAAQGIGQGTALDMRVDIMNSAGNSTLAFDDPDSGATDDPSGDTGVDLATGVNASAAYNSAPAGTYRIRVNGVGEGSPASNGYSDYGSIGQYQLTINGCTTGGSGTTSSKPQNVVTTPTAHSTTGSVSWDAPADNGGAAISGYTISGTPGGPFTVGASTFSRSLPNLVPGTTYSVSVTAQNINGSSSPETATIEVPTWVAVSAPGVTVQLTGNSVDVDWTPPSTNAGGATPGNWSWVLKKNGTVLLDDDPPGNQTGVTISPLSLGSYTVEVKRAYTSEEGAGFSATTTKSFSYFVKPSAPRIGTASTGTAGGAVNAIARWAAPMSNGGTAITNYRVYAYKLNSRNQVIRTLHSTLRPPSARSFVYALPAGRYKFRVIAYNVKGASPFSAYSRIVTAR